MKKSFQFKQNGYTAKVEISLTQNKNNDFVFSAVGSIGKTNCRPFGFGQCLDTIKTFIDDPVFLQIHNLWKKYHLNDMHAGTPEQEQAIRTAKQTEKLPSNTDYKHVCEYLKTIGLYEVDYNGKPYRYGSGWLTFPIPDEDIRKIMNLR